MNRGLLCLLLAAALHAALLWPKRAGKSSVALQAGNERTVDLVPLPTRSRKTPPVEKVAHEPADAAPEVPAATATPTLTIGRVVALGNEAPSYPDRAAENGWEGDVDLQLHLAVAGEVAEVAVERSSGFLVLDEAARRAALRWKLPPGPVAYRVRIEFRLR